MENSAKDEGRNIFDHHMFGTVKVGERGQIVIPKEAREIFGIRPGDLLLVFGIESRGISIVKADEMKEMALNILENVDKIEEE
ncbi:AbrB/MazE/SpoVT family DNA-binding domain-containing protein [Methanosarcina sp. T3]|uniref:AbrB/MazE/SpoVT family DNA-binding domain-containing protein n=1 Tax=Methanosarcina sp. T3 TaxID=3439062 RepID=UPI003F833ED1